MNDRYRKYYRTRMTNGLQLIINILTIDGMQGNVYINITGVLRTLHVVYLSDAHAYICRRGEELHSYINIFAELNYIYDGLEKNQDIYLCN